MAYQLICKLLESIQLNSDFIPFVRPNIKVIKEVNVENGNRELQGDSVVWG